MKVLSVALLLISLRGFAVTVPNPEFTPGVLCTTSDPDFEKLDYAENVPRCNRNVATPEKEQVAAEYGNIPKSDWANYEFDHMLPLCAGGSNDIRNLWPQPIAEAKEKDVVENEVCNGMKAGTMTQAEAVQKIHDFFAARAAAIVEAKE